MFRERRWGIRKTEPVYKTSEARACRRVRVVKKFGEIYSWPNPTSSEKRVHKIMRHKLKEQYDSLYASEEVVFGGGKPLEQVKNLYNYTAGKRVLDVGGGDGRNALYLAEQGYDVLVTDISPVGLEKLSRAALQKKVSVKTSVTDVVETDIVGMYDIIIFSFVLHHLDEAEATKVIEDAKQHTVSGGVHVIATFMNEGGLYERAKKSERFYPSEQDIRNLYTEWDIREMQIGETLSFAKDKEGNRMKNQTVHLVAQKR